MASAKLVACWCASGSVHHKLSQDSLLLNRIINLNVQFN